MDRDFQLSSFDEDNFDLNSCKKKASNHARAVAQAERVRRQITVAKVVLVIMLFVAGYCLYYLISELIARYEYNKYHTVQIIQTDAVYGKNIC